MLFKLLGKIDLSGEICSLLNLSSDQLSQGFGESGKLLNKEELRIGSSDKFIEEYVHLIGSIGKACKSDLWWASDIASKNRFTSRLPVILDQIQICTAALKMDFNHLIIYMPDFPVAAHLQKLFRNKFRIINLRNGKFKSLLRVFYYFLKKVHGLSKNLRYIIKRIIIFRVVYQSQTSKKDDSHVDYLLKTFTYDSSFDDESRHKDAFFGRLPDYLRKNGRLLTLTYILGNYRNCLNRLNNGNNSDVIPLENYISIFNVFKNYFRLLVHKFKIKDSIYFFDIDVANIIKKEFIRTGAGISLNQYLHLQMFKNLLKKSQIKKYILTYENNPWEKMSIAAFREMSPQTGIIGYQHSVVPQSAANVFCSKFEIENMPLPDKILTVGDEPKRIINSYSEKSNLNIQSCCGLRYEYLFNLKQKTRSINGNVLVALEGVIEVVPMLLYLQKEFIKAGKYRFSVRFHPAFPYERMKKYIGSDFFNASNVHISSGTSLIEDLQSNDICIYWGSTVSLEALKIGLPLIHFNNQQVWSYDPLFMCGDLKWVVTKNEPLLPIIEEIYSMDDVEYNNQAEKAKQYLENYFSPVTEQKIQEFIRN